MSVAQKLRASFTLKWFCSNSAESPIISSKIPISPIWLFPIFKNPKRYSTNRRTEKSTSSVNGEKRTHIRSVILKQAQEALLDYFYGTRNILFIDAENMSKNTPHFLENLLKEIDTEADKEWTIPRFLRYRPVNEFEPFFESTGLSPVEYAHLLPCDSIYLSDDEFFLENHNLLCDYGIERRKIGKIYKEAIEVLRYGSGVLQSKLSDYEHMGFSQSFLCNVIACSPSLLIGDMNMKFIKVLGTLKSLGFEMSWVEDQLSEESSYNWSTILEVLSLFSENGFGSEELTGLIRQHPGLIFERSGDTTLMLVGLHMKFGSTMNEVFLIFRRFPQIEVEKFVSNFRRCVQFLLEIKMNGVEILKIVRSHPILLGTCNLKKPNSIYTNLNVGKKRLCRFIQENPQELKKLVIGSKLKPLTNSEGALESRTMRNKFLMDLGYEENSERMIKALKLFRGKGSKLQERFDCIVKAGLERSDVCEIVRLYPQILNQSRDTIEMKINFLVNDLGYPISTLRKIPSYLNYTCQMVKLRLSMYNWLKDEGKVDPMLSLSTIYHCSEKLFVSQYVKRHPEGLQVWKNLKEQSYTQ